MRAIHLATVDKKRPVVVLTRDRVRPYLSNVTVALITSTIRGLATEVPVGPANGIDRESVVNCDSVVSVEANSLGPLIGFLLPHQEEALTQAIRVAFDLR